MKKQLDIFSSGTEERIDNASKHAGAGRRRSAHKRNHQVKMAPMIVDSFDAGGKAEVEVKVKAEAEEKTDPKNDARELSAGSDDEAAPAPRIFTISEITGLIKEHLENEFVDVWVSGEVTDFRGRNGKHLYFALKDESAKIRAIIFGKPLPFDLEDGMKLICRGKLNVYGPQGSYSLIIDPEHCEPEGIGALKLAFEQLKKRLEAEGLFRRERKRPIPFLPTRIGIVTAPTGAAVRDLIHVLTRRFPNIEILLHPVRVQGEGAAAEIAAAIGALNACEGLDVLIVGRGGGSIEDLWAFNEEIVARAIAASRIPVISAVGHEIDFTIADFVADLRAATPSAAAELAVPVRDDLVRAIFDLRDRLAGGLRRTLENRAIEVGRLRSALADPRKRLPDLMQRLDGVRQRLSYSMNVGMERRSQHLAKLASNLDHLSPLAVLSKGYSVVEGPDGRAVTSASSLKTGDEVRMRFHSGMAEAKVGSIKPSKD